MTPFRRNGSFHDTLMDVDEVASTVTFRGLPGPTSYTLNRSESVRLYERKEKAWIPLTKDEHP